MSDFDKYILELEENAKEMMSVSVRMRVISQ